MAELKSDKASDIAKVDDLEYTQEAPIVDSEKSVVTVRDVVYADGSNGRIAVGEPPVEARAAVPQTDDPDELCETLRSYTLGTIISIVGTGLNVWFGARQPGIYLSPLLAQFVAHPMGLAMAKFLPRNKFNCFGREFSLNPGPWTIKEHTLVTIMATVALPTATAIDIIIAVKLPAYFNDAELGNNWGFQFLTTISCTMLGFGIAGLAREFIVYPSAMIWPLNIAKISLFNALHRRTINSEGVIEVGDVDQSQPDPPINGWRVSMFRFCLYAMLGSFCYFFITSMIFPFLTYFNWPTWIAPTSATLAIVMGSMSGYGLNPLPTFDWTYINAAGLSPLITPWWATLSIFVGCSCGLVIALAMYFSNVWYSAYQLPNSNAAFDRFGLPYNVTRVLNDDRTLNVEAYREYSPLYFNAGYHIVFGAYFASYSASILYAALNHGEALSAGFKVLYKRVRSMFKKDPATDVVVERPDLDIHFVLMQRYREAPQWWFAVIALGAVVMGIISAEVYRTTMPIWGIFVCLLMALIFLVPAGIIQALSNIQISLVVLAQIIPGVAVPGRPYANMIFKLYGWIALGQALLYAQDQKLAHYLHLPPRATFRCQMLAVTISTFVSIGVINWQMSVIPDLCMPGQKDLMTCPYYTTFFSSAIMFGVVGPVRMYGENGLYKHLMWAFLIGGILTVGAWAIMKKWPNKFTKSVNIPVIITGSMFFAPYNWSFVYSGVPYAWFFMSYVYRRYSAWWNKYCYILSIGLTIGAALSGVFQFFCITFPGASIPQWWGNTVHVSGCDGQGCPYLPMPEKGYFGPGPGEYS